MGRFKKRGIFKKSCSKKREGKKREKILFTDVRWRNVRSNGRRARRGARWRWRRWWWRRWRWRWKWQRWRRRRCGGRHLPPGFSVLPVRDQGCSTVRGDAHPRRQPCRSSHRHQRSTVTKFHSRLVFLFIPISPSFFSFLIYQRICRW